MALIISTKNKPHILVFKTNLRFKRDAEIIKPLLEQLDHIKGWNIDREDHDKVLRVESATLCPTQIIDLIKNAGYHCEELED